MVKFHLDRARPLRHLLVSITLLFTSRVQRHGETKALPSIVWWDWSLVHLRVCLVDLEQITLLTFFVSECKRLKLINFLHIASMSVTVVIDSINSLHWVCRSEFICWLWLVERRAWLRNAFDFRYICTLWHLLYWSVDFLVFLTDRFLLVNSFSFWLLQLWRRSFRWAQLHHDSALGTFTFSWFNLLFLLLLSI